MNEVRKPPMKRVVPRFGPMLYWTIAGVVAGFIYGCVTSLIIKYGADYWSRSVVYYSCMGAIVGFLAGTVRDFLRKHL